MTETEAKRWYSIQNRSLPAPVADIHLFDEIGGWGISAEDFTRDLRAITAPTIRVHLNSPGGSVFAGLAIYTALKSHKATVETYNDSLAASIASVIFQAGSRRVMAPHSRLMIHEASAMAEGNAEDLAKMVERLEDASQNIASLYAGRSGTDAASWREQMRAETWFTPEAAVAAGLADEVGIADGDDGERDIAFGVLLGMPRQEIAACLTNTGRTLSASNLEKLHGVFETLNSIHSGACDLGDSCPLAVKGEATGTEPTNRHEHRRREVDRILAGLRR